MPKGYQSLAARYPKDPAQIAHFSTETGPTGDQKAAPLISRER
jgi:hypothetical protein